MVLRVRSSEKMKRSAQQSVVSEREKRPKSKSRPKSKQKKSTKIDAKMPKKPPTAFFYFLWVLLMSYVSFLFIDLVNFLSIITFLYGCSFLCFISSVFVSLFFWPNLEDFRFRVELKSIFIFPGCLQMQNLCCFFRLTNGLCFLAFKLGFWFLT